MVYVGRAGARDSVLSCVDEANNRNSFFFIHSDTNQEIGKKSYVPNVNEVLFRAYFRA